MKIPCGDAASGWMFDLFGKTLGLSVAATIAATLPFAALWLFASLSVGRMYQAKTSDASLPRPATG